MPDDVKPEPQGRALFSRDKDGNIVDAWIWEELLGDDPVEQDEYFHDIAEAED